MKKFFIIISLFTLCMGIYGCGGGGAGPADVPNGENPNFASILQLLPAQYVAQTGSYIFLNAKVLDGNGMVLPDVDVKFTNQAAIGALSSATAKTNGLGVATVTLYSTAAGFSTIQAEITTAAGQIRTKKTVYFSTYDLTWPSDIASTSPIPFMVFYVDADNDGVYNEQSDYTLFENTSDNQAKVLIILYDGSGSVVSGSSVTFSSDSGTEVTFPIGSTKTTDSDGQASVLVQVDPAVLRNLSTSVNITASATVNNTSVGGMVTLNLSPVTVASISVTATPTTISTDGTSSILASVKTTAGTPVPDGTTVTFSASCPPFMSVAYIDPPFAQTTSGSATATFTGPSSSNSCTVTATSGGMSATAYITVAAPAEPPVTVTPETLTIVPGAVTIASSAAAQTVTFTISGGTSPYTTTSTDPTKAFDTASGDGIWSGSPITVNIPANVSAGSVTLNVYDSKANTASAAITILTTGTTATTLSISPATITVSGIYNSGSGTEAPSNTADDVKFYITGGTSPYTVYSSNTGVIPNVAVTTTSASSGNFTIDPTSVAASTNVTLTVVDATGATKTATVTVTPAPASLAVNPSSITMTAPSSTTFYIIGGVGPFTVVSGNTAKVTVSGVTVPATGSPYFTVNALAVGSSTITVIDTGSGGLSATSTVTVN